MDVCWKISGRVQHVGYRRWVINKAAQIGGIFGYVHNDVSGDVFIYASGEENSLNLFKSYCFVGPLFARVDEITEAPEIKNYFPPIKNGEFLKI